ncbi:tRNA 2-thiouridine(34) synthase MnmA, partial [Candidatus Azambacteria bacterium RIFCSPHIGHO2_01_46_10]
MTISKTKKVFVAMSGGVDSSVAALLLKQKGYDVVGVFMKNWSQNLAGGECAWARDQEDARKVAAKIGIPIYTFDFEEEYKKLVVDYMLKEYAAGRTPNPDVMCNKEIKFGLFLEKALSLGADFVATGHYARLRRKSEIRNPKSETNPKLKISNYKLLQAKDKNKDQSYFLWTLGQEQLKYCLFPIGDYFKSEAGGAEEQKRRSIRETARKFGLPTADKKDSQGVCFIGKFDFAEFLKSRIPANPGQIKTVDGKVVGEHDGLAFYTVGQRHLKISNLKNQKSNSLPVYVSEKNIK